MKPQFYILLSFQIGMQGGIMNFTWQHVKLLKTCTLRLCCGSNMIGKLLENKSSNCPSLDDLCIVRCRMTSIKISCQMLKVLAIKGCKYHEAAELDTPNLVSLNSLMNKLSYSFNTTSLHEVGLSFYLSCMKFALINWRNLSECLIVMKVWNWLSTLRYVFSLLFWIV